MPITVRHGIDPALTVQAGVLAGAGDLSRHYQGRMDRYRQQAIQIQASKDMQASSIKAQMIRQANQISAQKQLADMGDAAAIDRMKQGLANQQALAADQHAYGLEDMAAKDKQFKETYTWKQKQEMDRLANVRNNIMSDPAYGSVGEMTDMRQQALWDIDRAGVNIRPSKVPKEEEPFDINEWVKGSVAPAPGGGFFFTGPKGPEYRPPKISKEEIQWEKDKQEREHEHEIEKEKIKGLAKEWGAADAKKRGTFNDWLERGKAPPTAAERQVEADVQHARKFDETINALKDKVLESSNLSPSAREKARSLPFVTSEAEGKILEPGTMYLAPDGLIHEARGPKKGREQEQVIERAPTPSSGYQGSTGPTSFGGTTSFEGMA